jgi:hypothetical protein
MLRRILTYGLIAGAIAGGQLFLMFAVIKPDTHGAMSMVVGYASMLVGFSLIFVAVKQHRDKALGGVIKFLPAFGMGLAISVIGCFVYALAWEAMQPLMAGNYMEDWVAGQIASMKEHGATQAEIDVFTQENAWMVANYSNPLIRIPISMLEPMPVGLVVSLIVAVLLRNSRFMPARATA